MHGSASRKSIKYFCFVLKIDDLFIVIHEVVVIGDALAEPDFKVMSGETAESKACTILALVFGFELAGK